MGLFDFGRERQEAKNTLADLRYKSVTSRHRFTQWEQATQMLRDVYTRERADNVPAAEMRIRYLEVPEPQPAMEDFVAYESSRYPVRDPVDVLRATRSRFEGAWYQHLAREQARLGELEFARARLAQIVADAEAIRHKARLALWSRYTTLDPDIAAIDSTEGQVAAENSRIEKQVHSLSRILKEGLSRLPLPIVPDLSDFADSDTDPKAVAREAEYQLELASLYDDLEVEKHFRVAYSPDSRQLVVECELPDVSVVPKAKHYRYIKSRNEIADTARPQSQVKAIYAQAIAQITLLCIATVFATDQHAGMDVVVFNGIVDTIDPRSPTYPPVPCHCSSHPRAFRRAQPRAGRPASMLEAPVSQRLEEPNRTGSR
jgi:restriction system protein